MDEILSYGSLFVSEEAYSTFVFGIAVACGTLAIFYFICLVCSLLIDLIRYKAHLPKRKWVVIFDYKWKKQDP